MVSEASSPVRTIELERSNPYVLVALASAPLLAILLDLSKTAFAIVFVAGLALAYVLSLLLKTVHSPI